MIGHQVQPENQVTQNQTVLGRLKIIQVFDRDAGGNTVNFVTNTANPLGDRSVHDGRGGAYQEKLFESSKHATGDPGITDLAGVDRCFNRQVPLDTGDGIYGDSFGHNLSQQSKGHTNPLTTRTY